LRAALAWPVPLLLIPYIVVRVGVTEYGIWAVFLVIINFTSLTDLGLGGTLTKHVAEYYARGDRTALNRLVNTSLMLYTLIATLLVAILCFTSNAVLPYLFRQAPLVPSQLRLLSYLLAATAGVNVLTFPFYSIIAGLQRLDLSNILTSLNILVNTILTVALLSRGWGILGLLLAKLGASLALLLSSLWIVRELVPELHLNPFASDRGRIRPILSFGLQMYFTQVASTIHMQMNKLYLALLMGVDSAGLYTIAGDTAWTIRTIPEMLLSPSMAAAAELNARGEEEKLRQLFFRSHKYLALFGVPMTVFVAVFSKSLVELWLGPQLGIVAVPLAILTVINVLNLSTGPGYFIFVGKGNLKPGMVSATVSVLANLILGLILVSFFGLGGAVLASSTAIIMGTLLFVYLFHHQTGYPLAQTVWKAYLKPLLCSLIPAILLAAGGLPLGWGGLILRGVFFGAAYLVGLAVSRFFDDFDLAKAESILPAARFVRRIIPVA
jgi:O-antigen/teichoic acid export membrane protein